MLLVWVVDRQALLPHCGNFRQQLLLPLGVQGAVGLQGAAEIHHRIHAGQALDLLGQLTCRRQLPCPLEKLIGFRYVGAALNPQQDLLFDRPQYGQDLQRWPVLHLVVHQLFVVVEAQVVALGAAAG